MMKNLAKTLLLATCLAASPAFVSAHSDTAGETTQTTTYGSIDSTGLKALQSSGTNFQLLDARTDKYFHGEVIPGAKRLPSDSTTETVEKTLPDKNQLIVVYCAGVGCNASKNLATMLVKEGYTNVIDFHGGDREWKSKGYSMEKIS